ncbi:MAG TPA: CocE/NonD family hydrolase, partial [Verrucomicrobiae bacterium]|nr:CocE/NonD family hydrolase [Verrucomicrobiae bacterium]
ATSADRELIEYFRAETARLATNCLAEIKSGADWLAHRDEYRRELFEMLGLSPLPPKTGLNPVITGAIDAGTFTVEKLQFQSLPGLYIAANLYLPKGTRAPAPTILYVSGHGPVITNKVSYGNKVSYQHHGEWFARNGYVCLVLDTIQWGEILGSHHGTYREGQWWWNSRGYTPAGVEAWNSMRALDYLSTRPEVDANRFGVTGRSGGGAYSWWLAALDDRIKCAAPVAGITDLQNHVVDGCVEGHCDCMYMVNTYRWDYPQVAALVAPRPLLIANTDKDSIFPLDGVERLHQKVARVYELLNARDNLGLLITDGPHKDTQDLQLPVFRWFNRHLKAEDPVISMPAEPLLAPQQLKVFSPVPSDERTSRIHETFVPVAPVPKVPQSAGEWKPQREAWMKALKEKVFHGWPVSAPTLAMSLAGSGASSGTQLQAWDFNSQEHARLRLYVLQSKPFHEVERIDFRVLGEADWQSWMDALREPFGKSLEEEVKTRSGGKAGEKIDFRQAAQKIAAGHSAIVLLAPRGIGLTQWSGDERKQTHLRRRFMLLGQTIDGMRVWDIQRGVLAIRELPALAKAPVILTAEGNMAANALYASLFSPEIKRLELSALPAMQRDGPDYLNVSRFLDIPQALALAAERQTGITLTRSPGDWSYPVQTKTSLRWPEESLQIESGK